MYPQAGDQSSSMRWLVLLPLMCASLDGAMVQRALAVDPIYRAVPGRFVAPIKPPVSLLSWFAPLSPPTKTPFRFTLDDGQSWESITGELSSSRRLLLVVRHGHAVHNRKGAKAMRGLTFWLPYKQRSCEHFDADLTEKGERQARRLNRQLKPFFAENIHQDMALLVSPLKRAIDTARRGFKGITPAHAPWIADELCREQIGGNMCDARRSINSSHTICGDYDSLESLFGEMVQFSMPKNETQLGFQSDTDPAYLDDEVLSESYDELEERANRWERASVKGDLLF